MALTVEQVTEVLKFAAAAVKDAGVPAALQPVAFEKAVDLLTGDAKPHAPHSGGGAAGSSGTGTGAGAAAGAPAGDSSPLDAIAAKLRLDKSVIEEVFHVEDGELKVIVPTKKVAPGKTAGTQELALLVAAGRQAGGFDQDSFTDVSYIREVAKDYKRIDAGNFAAHMTGLDYCFNSIGAGVKRRVKLSNPGWDKARELVERLTTSAP